jgi:hypothetical protein
MRRAAVALVALACAFVDGSAADEKLLGKWTDNAPQRAPTGALSISPDKLSFGKRVEYAVRSAGAFGAGELFEVTSLNRKTDPFGCGPDQRVHYLAVERLPQTVAGGSEAIRVFFYAGKSPPKAESIMADTGVCLIHPYGRP